MTPVATRTSPMGVVENNDQISIFCPSGNDVLDVSIRSLSRISGDEPTIVTVPPRIAQKPIGINSRDMGKFERDDIRETTGRNKAAAPTFCIKDEIIATVLEIIGMILASEVPPIFRIKLETFDIIPVLSKPAPMIITAMIDITALLENPLKS